MSPPKFLTFATPCGKHNKKKRGEGGKEKVKKGKEKGRGREERKYVPHDFVSDFRPPGRRKGRKISFGERGDKKGKEKRLRS